MPLLPVGSRTLPTGKTPPLLTPCRSRLIALRGLGRSGRWLYRTAVLPPPLQFCDGEQHACLALWTWRFNTDLTLPTTYP